MRTASLVIIRKSIEVVHAFVANIAEHENSKSFCFIIALIFILSTTVSLSIADF